MGFVKQVQRCSGIDEESSILGLTEPGRLMQRRARVESRCCQISAGPDQQRYCFSAVATRDVRQQPIFFWIAGSSNMRMSREDSPRLVQASVDDRYGEAIRLIQVGARAS